jgi:two-component system, NtrC family, response regulator AlgB
MPETQSRLQIARIATRKRMIYFPIANPIMQKRNVPRCGMHDRPGRSDAMLSFRRIRGRAGVAASGIGFVQVHGMDAREPAALRILVVDDDTNVRKSLAMSLQVDGHETIAVSNGRDAVVEAAQRHFDIAFVDLRLQTTSGLDLIPQLLAQSPWLQIIIISAYGAIESSVAAIKRGAIDFLVKPFTPVQVRNLTESVARQLAHKRQVDRSNGIASTFNSENTEMRRLYSLAEQVARSDTTILLRGESGTGKGVLAQAIHEWSARRALPFATVSIPALSPQLLESELFGHVRGAFTGAVRDNSGRIAACDGGTLFLDEIGDLSLELQPKLLRFVQDRQYERVGEAITRRTDVRMIAATNVNLEEAVRAGRFREDLFYRIKVIQIDVPPLRRRPEDVMNLATQFVDALEPARTITGFSDDARSALERYNWPGNIRELRNVIERAVALCKSPQIGLEHLPGNFMPSNTPIVELGDPISIDKLEELHIRRVLARSKSIEEAARILEMDPATLWRRRKRYGI